MNVFLLLATTLSSFFILSSESEKPKAVIVMSLDGIGYQQLQKIDGGFTTVNQVTPLKPGNPSLTFPGHATLATGVSPAQHGVFLNRLSGADYSFIQSKEDSELYSGLADRLRVPPIWFFAKQQGLEVFIHQWAMSKGQWCGNDIRDNADQDFSYEDVTIEKTTSITLEKIKNWNKQKNLLIYSYGVGLDQLGHIHGPFATETVNEWQNIKSKLDSFISDIKTFANESNIDVSLYIVSDHGMYENWFSESIDIKHYLQIKGFPDDIPFAARPKVFAFPGYTLSQEQLSILMTDFKIVQAPNGLLAFQPKSEDQVFSIVPQSDDCSEQSTDTPYLWTKCKIFGGGHHVYKETVHQSHLDGIFWQPIGKKRPAPHLQTDLVPLVASDLNIDISKQNEYKACEIRKIETTE